MNNLEIKNKWGTTLTAANWEEGFIAVDEKRHWRLGRSAERLANDFSDGFYYSIPFNRVYLIKRIMDKYNDQEGGALNEPD